MRIRRWRRKGAAGPAPAARRLAAGGTLLAVLVACGGSGSGPGPAAPAAPTAPTEPTESALRGVEAELVRLLADHRAAADLTPTARDPALDEVAREWSERMAVAGEPSHNPAYAAEIPPGSSTSGENVGWADLDAYPLADLPAALHQGWVDSPSHRANLDNPGYTAVGIGAAYDPDTGVYVTANFAAYP